MVEVSENIQGVSIIVDYDFDNGVKSADNKFEIDNTNISSVDNDINKQMHNSNHLVLLLDKPNDSNITIKWIYYETELKKYY